MTGPLVAAVRAAVDRAACVVALGGGADSAALLGAALEANLSSLRAVFVNHGLESSHLLCDAATSVADHLGVPLAVVDAVIVDGPDLEARARLARYAAIETNLAPGEVCCTGHTADDQAETVLMRLLRGSGAKGLAGIPERRGRFLRPLLGVSRAELRTFCLDTGLPFADDPANSDERFLRNQIRTVTLPSLEAAHGPGVRDNLALSGSLLRDDDELLEGAADGITVSESLVGGTRLVSIPVAPITTSPPAVSSRAIRRALGLFHNPYHGSHSDVASVLATAADGARRTLTDGLWCARENAEIVLFQKPLPLPADPMTVTLESGVVQWGEDRYRISRSSLPSLRSTCGRRTALRDLHAGESLGFRAVVDGDKLEIDGGSARVTEVLREAGVPSRLRPFWLAVTIDGKIAAIHGIKAASWARPVGGSRAIIIEREGPM